MLDDRAGDHIAEPLALQLEALHQRAQRRRQQLLVVGAGVGGMRAGEGNADAADDGYASGTGSDLHGILLRESWCVCATRLRPSATLGACLLECHARIAAVTSWRHGPWIVHCGFRRRTGKMRFGCGIRWRPVGRRRALAGRMGGMMAGNVVDRVYERRLAALVNSREQRLIARGRRGLERESLRVTPDGHIAQTPHPRALGASLTNPHITTDYSEALTELVTPTFDDNEQLLQYLGDLHQFVYAHLGEELLWATSMPCIVGGEAAVPIARFGDSYQGRVKYIYRHGLLVRYGGMMQAISGVHFNYSVPEQFWPMYAEICQCRDSDQDFVSRATSICYAITGATAGWSATCSAPRRRCAAHFCRAGRIRNCSRWARRA